MIVIETALSQFVEMKSSDQMKNATAHLIVMITAG